MREEPERGVEPFALRQPVLPLLEALLPRVGGVLPDLRVHLVELALVVRLERAHGDPVGPLGLGRLGLERDLHPVRVPRLLEAVLGERVEHAAVARPPSRPAAAPTPRDRRATRAAAGARRRASASGESFRSDHQRGGSSLVLSASTYPTSRPSSSSRRMSRSGSMLGVVSHVRSSSAVTSASPYAATWCAFISSRIASKSLVARRAELHASSRSNTTSSDSTDMPARS